MQSEEYHYVRGMKAETILRDDNFNEMFEIITSEVVKEILETSLDDTKFREQLYITVNGMRAFNERLVRYVAEKQSIEDARNAELDQQEIDY